MEAGITIFDFLETKEITSKEIEDNFQFVTEYDIDMIHYDGCPHCKDKSNQYHWKSAAWIGVTECAKCQSIILTFYSDRMGGVHTDTVRVYEQKNRPMYLLYFKCNIQKDCIECRHCGHVSSGKDNIKNLFCSGCNTSLK